MSFIYFTLLARSLGAEAIGQYTFALAFTTIFSIITDLGLTPVLIREIARDKTQGIRYLRNCLGVKIILELVAYASVLTAAFLLGHPSFTLQLITIAGLIMVLDGFHLIFYGVLRGLQTLRYEAAGMIAGQGITLILGIIFLVAHLPLYAFLIALGFGSVWNVIFSIIILRRHQITLLPAFDTRIVRFLFATALPFAFAGIFVKVYSYIDTVLLQHLKGNIVVGWYSVPYKITYAFQMIPMALSAAIYPAFSSAWQDSKEKVNKLLNSAMRYSLMIVLPITFGIAALAPEIILTIYGIEFINSIQPLRISIFGLIFIFLYFPLGALLNASGHQLVNTVFMGLTMATNIIINLILIPTYSAVGASWAAVVTNAFLFFSVLIWSRRLSKISNQTLLNALKISGAALVMLFVVQQTKQIIAWPITIPLGGLIYGVLLYLTKAISRADFLELKKLFKKESIPTEVL